MTETLVKSEVDLLATCEEIIEKGLKTFVEVGRALMEIRDCRLYRETHDSFEVYCRERWSLSKPYATQLITASQTVAIATANGAPAPSVEAVARELTPLRDEPEELAEAWTQTVERHGPEPTAAQTREVVREIRSSDAATPEDTKGPDYTYCPTCGHRVRADKPLRPRKAA
jgi:hypothetical protein